MAYNEHTGQKMISKVNTKEFEDNFDNIFRRKTDKWDESRIDIIGQNGDILVTEWKKHDGSRECPIPKGTKVVVETLNPQTNITYFAEDINWRAVKYYKVIGDK